MRALPSDIDGSAYIPGASSACWSPDDVAERLLKAGQVIRSREGRVMPAGYGQPSWPDMLAERNVDYAPEQARYRVRYSPKDQDAADEAVEWVMRLPVESRGTPPRSIVAARMLGMSFSRIGRRHGISTYRVTRQWRDGPMRIAGALNRG